MRRRHPAPASLGGSPLRIHRTPALVSARTPSPVAGWPAKHSAIERHFGDLSAIQRQSTCATNPHIARIACRSTAECDTDTRLRHCLEALRCADLAPQRLFQRERRRPLRVGPRSIPPLSDTLVIFPPSSDSPCARPTRALRALTVARWRTLAPKSSLRGRCWGDTAMNPQRNTNFWTPGARSPARTTPLQRNARSQPAFHAH